MASTPPRKRGPDGKPVRPPRRDEPFLVSQSKVSDWQLCRRKYHYRYTEHLKPRAPARPLKFGSIMHELFDIDARGKDMQKQLKRIAKREAKLLERTEEYGQLLDDVAYIANAYKQFWSAEPLVYKQLASGRQVPLKMIEVPFKLELTSEITAKGRIDGLVTAKKADWILEHKTHASFPNADHRWRNIQSAIYLRIVEMLGWASPSGMLWDYVRSKAPARPKLLLSGKISTAECDSLPAVITDTAALYIKEGHKQVELQQAAIAELAAKQNANLHTWFQRVFTPIQPAVIKGLFADFIATAREMVDYYDKHPATPPRKSIGLHCSWCAFEPLCRAELQGNDIDFVRDNQFVFDDSDYQTEIVE
jgi:CRISPR/Cas system-associated exonuclease Cas4 (RecB family)